MKDQTFFYEKLIATSFVQFIPTKVKKMSASISGKLRKLSLRQQVVFVLEEEQLRSPHRLLVTQWPYLKVHVRYLPTVRYIDSKVGKSQCYL